MTDAKSTAAAPGEAADLTAQHELAQLEAMAGEEGAAADTAAAEANEIAAEGKAERAVFYAHKVRPFVDAWGSRLRYPLHEKEAAALAESLGAVGAEIIPGDPGKPINPWVGLVLVLAGIGVPRAIRSMNEKRQAQGAAPARAAAEKKSTDPMLDGLSDFDAQQRQPH